MKCGDAICGTYINLCEITKFPCKLAQVSKTFRIFANKIKIVMEATVRSRRTADNYWNIIRHLSPDAKLDLISMITKSLKKTTPKRVLAKKYYGIWGDDGMSDDEFVKELKSLRSFNREIIEL